MKYPIRLDKFLAHHTGLSRSQLRKALREQPVQVNGDVVKDQGMHIHREDKVVWMGDEFGEAGFSYIMMNKPAGYVSTDDASEHPSAIYLIDEPFVERLHCAGRLDLDSTGMLLITDDGSWSHRITSPKHQKAKVYEVTLADPVTEDHLDQLRKGILLRNEETETLPCEATLLDEQHVRLTIYEGRYHQVKRMFAALGNKVEALHRAQIGDIILDEDLEPGEWRYLTDEEVAVFSGNT
ncbi:16S rRNA pseudouridine(516) synthase RsuA [Pokkaliibacter sp. CJK22405]|uniref:16S rRNA pseudouridine(516) synthase RsuA n=1 Tax=Pokkaliibacter sp. CJK22405 TaxID=3384615 RepID=UPI003985643D